MAANEAFQELHTLPDITCDWDELALSLLKNSRIDIRRKKHRLGSLKKPRAIQQVILKLQEPKLRESALHLLSSFLFEKREEDLENYYRIGLLLYDSCCTMVILIQEILSVYGMIIKHNLTERASMHLINVLILFQSRETYVINWALESSVMEVSMLCIHTGNELTKVVGLHIVDSILQNPFGIDSIYNPLDNRLLNKLFKTLENLVESSQSTEMNKQCYYPQLIFHVVRCYTLLCNHIRGVNVVKIMLPNHLWNSVFSETLQEYPFIRILHHRLLLILGQDTSLLHRGA